MEIKKILFRLLVLILTPIALVLLVTEGLIRWMITPFHWVLFGDISIIDELYTFRIFEILYSRI